MEITEFLQNHWVSILVASYLIGMMLYGHHRGFLHLSISMAALAVSSGSTFCNASGKGIHKRKYRDSSVASGNDDKCGWFR